MCNILTIQSFGTINSVPVKLYTITCKNGISVGIVNYGAAIVSIVMPDKNGKKQDVVLGFSNIEGYKKAQNFYMGSVCGRYANRIANATIQHIGKVYQLSSNEQSHILHGGFKGFDKVVWDVDVLENNRGIQLTYLSKDGEEGFPGNLKATVTYVISNNALDITFQAETDIETPVNLTSHAYFNLSGYEGAETIEQHELFINANYYLETNQNNIPTGKIISVSKSDMDFTSAQLLADKLKTKPNFDNTWCINRNGKPLSLAAELLHKPSARSMKVYTTQPGIHFYTANNLHPNLQHVKHTAPYKPLAGLCLETQHYPDSPNQPNFPNTWLRPDEKYFEQTVYEFNY